MHVYMALHGPSHSQTYTFDNVKLFVEVLNIALLWLKSMWRALRLFGLLCHKVTLHNVKTFLWVVNITLFCLYVKSLETVYVYCVIIKWGSFLSTKGCVLNLANTMDIKADYEVATCKKAHPPGRNSRNYVFIWWWLINVVSDRANWFQKEMETRKYYHWLDFQEIPIITHPFKGWQTEEETPL